MIDTLLNGWDVWVVARELATVGFYAAVLMAVGGVLFRAAFPALPVVQQERLVRVSQVAAWMGIGLALLLCPLHAAYLGGGSLSAAYDSTLLWIVLHSAQGERLCLAVVGLLLLQVALIGGRLPLLRHVVGSLGIVLVLVAFALVGHTRGKPMLSGLLIAHLAMAAFWLAALLPLYRLLRAPQGSLPARQLQRFSYLGAGMIAVLLIAGGVLAAWLLGGRVSALWLSAYGQVLSLKLALVALLLALGGLNRWRLVPALARGERHARRHLRLSIAGEGVVMALVLFAAALLMNAGAPMT
ncbi:CopD family protein [Aidingimonas lacisalsi]|uniref:CopD family protein n=1 Tax=Aidingimonas lacisalsi TaxID=2604086 RepID=UPI0011D22644|nr:CopD family protein [Aidingimonas lacisalsi]